MILGDSTTRRHRAWLQLLDNPLLPIIGYLAIIGLLTALVPGEATPSSVKGTTPWWLTTAWEWSFLLGGLVAVVGSLSGRTRAESAGLAWVVFGLGMFALAELVFRGAWALPQAVALAALLSACLLRMRQLRKARKAHRLAARGGAPPWSS